MNPEPTDLNDLAAIARTTRSVRYRRALASATAEIELLRTRVKELEELTLAMSDWHIDMVLGDAWLCRIEGKFEDVDRLLGEAVGNQIQSYEIDTQHHENTND